MYVSIQFMTSILHFSFARYPNVKNHLWWNKSWKRDINIRVLLLQCTVKVLW